VPEAFVGPPGRCAELVRLLAQEMAEDFAARGRPLPPWRRVTALLERFLPRRYADAPVAADGTIGAADDGGGGGGGGGEGGSPQKPAPPAKIVVAAGDGAARGAWRVKFGFN